jgi:hypothetical protein
MTTYYVDGNNGNDSGDGSTTRPWKTLNKANSSIKSGDEVRVRSAVYHEELVIRTSQTTWIADSGQKPVLDGRYHEGLRLPDGTMPSPTTPGNNFLPKNGSAYDSLVSLNGEGIVFDGFSIQNVAGAGISALASRVVVRNCRVDFAYSWAIRVTPSSFSDGILVENNIVTRTSLRGFGAAINSRNTRDAIFRNNVVAYSYGDGVVLNDGVLRNIVEGNIIHTCRRALLYNELGVDTIFRNNLVYHLGLPEFSNPEVPEGILMAWETVSPIMPGRSGGQIYNNIVINAGTLLNIRNNDKTDTTLDGTYIGFNTFISGPNTRFGVIIRGNQNEKPHRDSLFENNLIFSNKRSEASGDLSGIAFRNNLWSQQPPPAMRGPSDRVGDPNLSNPGAKITGRPIPDPTTDIDPRNYQLTTASALAIGMASDGSPANNLTPPAISKDFFGANRDASPDIGAHEYLGATAGITANFSIGPNQALGRIPHTVDFTDKSTSARPITSRLWEFGDGETATETNPSHTYTKEGNFDVSLTVADDQSQKDKITRTGLIAVNREPTTNVPAEFRRFILRKVADQHILAFGAQYPDLHCVQIWNEEPYYMVNFNNIDDLASESVIDGETEILWLDPEEQYEALDDLSRRSDDVNVKAAAGGGIG